MKITRTIPVTQDEFYDYLESDLLNIIQKKTNKKMSAKDIKKGLKYSIYDGEDKAARVDITITEYIRGEIYKAKMKSFADCITLCYETKPTEKGLEVTFEQRIQSFETTHHNKVSQKFQELTYGMRMSQAIYDIQTKIEHIREGIEEKDMPQPIGYKTAQKLLDKRKQAKK